MQHLEQTLQTVRQRIRSNGHDLTWELCEPAQAEQIAACEAAIGRELPASYKAFLRRHDGAALSVDRQPGLSHNVYIFGTAAVAEEHGAFATHFHDVFRDGDVRWSGEEDEEFVLPRAEQRFWPGLIAFAVYGAGRCVFDSDQRSGDEYAVLDLDTEDTYGTRDRVIADSFDDWLERALASAEREYNLVYWPM